MGHKGAMHVSLSIMFSMNTVSMVALPIGLSCSHTCMHACHIPT